MTGYNVLLYVLCFQLLWNHRKTDPQQSYVYIGYLTVLLILGTLYVVSDTRLVELAYVDHADFPGGPVAYALQEYSSPIEQLGNASYVVTNWLADGLMVS